MRFDHICIVGVGLIGGSFALAARRTGLAARITGYDDPLVLEKACQAGIIDDVERSFQGRVECHADLVYLAAPVGNIIDFIMTQAKLVKPGAIITDAGSTKREICRAARESVPAKVHFVGGHPIAGSHNSGVEFATADLFHDAPYAVVIDERAERIGQEQSDAVTAVIETVRAMGAVPVILTAARHDRAIARTSHAPQLLSVALARSIDKNTPDQLGLVGSGFRDMTRLARSNWSVWDDICRTNADEIDEALKEVVEQVNEVRRAISSGEFGRLQEAFAEANRLTGGLRSREQEIKND